MSLVATLLLISMEISASWDSLQKKHRLEWVNKPNKITILDATYFINAGCV